MSQARDEATTRQTQKQIAELETLGWYHSIDLPDGTVIKGLLSVEVLRSRLAQFNIPADLHGKRVLDIGAWDGFYTFEMERRGAQVVALDLIRNEKFLLARDLLKSRAEYIVGDICKIPLEELGRFDIVLFFGVLYHVKHPLLALERVCEMTTDLACIESYVTDSGEDLSALPVLEFYEGTELRGQFDNWVGPNVTCLLGMARTAGFVEVQLESVIQNRAHVSGRRKWTVSSGDGPAPAIICVENSITRDHDFSVKRDDYFSLWFKCGIPELRREDVFIEVGPYAARPAQVVTTGGDGWHAVSKLPPGLDPGFQPVRVRVKDSQFSNVVRIPVDLSPTQRHSLPAAPISRDLGIGLVTDGKSWERWRVKIGVGSCLSVWTRGIPDECEIGQIYVILDKLNLPAVFLSETDGEGLKQVNAMLPAGLQPGRVKLRIECLGKTSEPVEIALVS